MDYPEQLFKKSNILISAKYQSTLKENKIMALALSNQDRMIEDKGGTIRVSIPASELKAALNANGGSFYDNLKDTANRLNNRQIGIVEDKSGQFGFFQIVQTCQYDGGFLNMTFNSDLSQYIKDIQKNFTKLNLPVMMSFKKDCSFRLYEILKSKAYNRKEEESRDKWDIKYSLSELMFLLGAADAQDLKAKRELNNKKTPDYDKAIDSVDKKKNSYTSDWQNFKSKMIVPAIKEINDKTELYVDYKPDKGGTGGKVIAVTFIVEYKNVVEENISDIDKDEVLDWLSDNCEYNIKLKDLRTIANAAKYDKEKIEKAFNILNKTSKVDNIVGFLIKAIEENWDEPITKQKVLSNFNERDEDWDEIAKDFIQN